MSNKLKLNIVDKFCSDNILLHSVTIDVSFKSHFLLHFRIKWLIIFPDLVKPGVAKVVNTTQQSTHCDQIYAKISLRKNSSDKSWCLCGLSHLKALFWFESQNIHFFIKFLCSPILMELDQDIWQIIFELVTFYEITIGKALALSSFVLEGGSGVWITLYT